MRPTRHIFSAILFLILCQTGIPAFSQLGIPITITKPKEYEDRVLRSEKMETTKFKLPTRFIQNTVTHYNYFFNANNKLNEVLANAKAQFRDDYSTLLPFYNYSLDVTAGDSVQLDSIRYKSESGIALHDLRGDWIDNLYLLWGASYYLQKKFDSAYLMFQFINYAFAPKEKDGYYLTIGSMRDGNSPYSISTKEKDGFIRKIFTEPPSRNDAFIWQIRNYLAQNRFAESSSLIQALRKDPNFPKRLDNDLEEVQALQFYKQKIWDSAAFHLTNALSNATTTQEKARWEYLAAQLYEKSGDYKNANKLYDKVSSHTTDPILDIYARLSTIRVNRDDETDIQKNVAKLLRMAKQDKYEDYRDIIYYMAAQMLLQGKHVDEAIALLIKSTKYSNNGPEQRNKAFLQLANLLFAKKEYRPAYNYYDSLQFDQPGIDNRDEIIRRKDALQVVAQSLDIIDRQDSLQRIAALPEKERIDFVKKLVRKLRKAQGLKDEDYNAKSPFNTPSVPSLFPTSTRGEWYFYNASSKSRGQEEFVNKWGNRPNVDNWRRSAVITNPANIPPDRNRPNNVTGNNPSSGQPLELTFESLYDVLPLTPEKIKISNDSIQEAMLALGASLIQNLDDCDAGTKTLEELRTQFPEFPKMDEVIFNLYYCYHKNGNAAKADALKTTLSKEYNKSRYNTILTTGINPASGVNPEATKTYEDIYDLFIEGKFDEAVAAKKKADSLYQKNFWTPQLLYIESVYYIKQRKDSIAKRVLSNLIAQFRQSPIQQKAVTLLNVLNRRAEIEKELQNLDVTRIPEDTVAKLPVMPVVTNVYQDSSSVKPVVTNQPAPDTITTKAPPKLLTTTYKNAPEKMHFVVIVLHNIDKVFSNETKNAFDRYNRNYFYNKKFTEELIVLDDTDKLLMISPFNTAQEALDYIEKTKPKTATEIVPWLKGGKYSFLMITEANYELLQVKKDLSVYQQFLQQNYPGKFE